MDEIRSLPLSHPQIASRIHRRAYEILGNPDPFAELKALGNQQAREVTEEIHRDLTTFREYVLASVIGNTFDYGVKGHTVEKISLFFSEGNMQKDLLLTIPKKLPPFAPVLYI